MSFTGSLARTLPLAEVLRSIPYLVSSLSYALDLIISVILLRTIGGVGIVRQWEAVGLGKPWRASALMGACLFIPVALLCLVLVGVADDARWDSNLFLGLYAPLIEEITYRGLATGVLILIAGWRFWSAALLPAAVFGLAHFSQGSGWEEVAGIVAITALGGLFFSWLYRRFGDNLWPAFILHAGMNLVWNTFHLGDNALGGMLGNGQRIAVVVGAILFALKGREWLRRVSGES